MRNRDFAEQNALWTHVVDFYFGCFLLIRFVILLVFGTENINGVHNKAINIHSKYDFHYTTVYSG